MLNQRDWKDAELSQFAGNLSGLAHSLSQVVQKIWAEARATGKGTDWVNRHPIVRMYTYQMFYLAWGYDPATHIEGNDKYRETSDKVRDEAAKSDAEREIEQEVDQNAKDLRARMEVL